MDTAIIVSIIGLIVAIISVGIAYLQLKYQLLEFKQNRSLISFSTTPIEDSVIRFTIFTPEARIRGFSKKFINRRKELQESIQHIDNKSVLIVQGVAGIGKTSLVANLITKYLKRWKSKWIICRERAVTLDGLISSIAFDKDLPVSNVLMNLSGKTVDESARSDALIDYLSHNKIILIFDDYHKVEDGAVKRFIELFSECMVKSRIILISDILLEFEAKGFGVSYVVLEGLGIKESTQFLESRGIKLSSETQSLLWKKAGKGVPQALLMIAGLFKRSKNMPETVNGLPIYTDDLQSWIETFFRDLSPIVIRALKFIAFASEPVKLDLIQTLERENIKNILDGMVDNLIISSSHDKYSIHPLFEDYLLRLIEPHEVCEFRSILSKYYQRNARNLLLGIGEHPSYGKLYLEAFPDYVNNLESHQEFIKNLIERLSDLHLYIHPGDKVAVLGAGSGTHDQGFAFLECDLFNVELLLEAIEIGTANAKKRKINVNYLQADITKPLPLEPKSMDAVFNIGSSFGFESDDEQNDAIFQNAARILKDGSPFVFEYVNGNAWIKDWNSMQNKFTTCRLSNGSVRMQYKIFDPVAETSLDVISLQRPDGTIDWFHHFIHYYSFEEIKAMLNRAGLQVILVFGDVIGTPYDMNHSQSMVIIAKKTNR